VLRVRAQDAERALPKETLRRKEEVNELASPVFKPILTVWKCG
jgi:hypothetical protein